MAKKDSAGVKDNPWKLKTPPGTAEYEAYRAKTWRLVPLLY